jgi:hypothetical protein
VINRYISRDILELEMSRDDLLWAIVWFDDDMILYCFSGASFLSISS